MFVTVKFVGALRHVAGKSEVVIDCLTNFSVKELIQKIIIDMPEIKNSIINQHTVDTVKNNSLILINDREISVLNGIATMLADGDRVVFIPVVHGG
jgi:MoaD family protein